jgi:hypothetical protein
MIMKNELKDALALLKKIKFSKITISSISLKTLIELQILSMYKRWYLVLDPWVLLDLLSVLK